MQTAALYGCLQHLRFCQSPLLSLQAWQLTRPAKKCPLVSPLSQWDCGFSEDLESSSKQPCGDTIPQCCTARLCCSDTYSLRCHALRKGPLTEHCAGDTSAQSTCNSQGTHLPSCCHRLSAPLAMRFLISRRHASLLPSMLFHTLLCALKGALCISRAVMYSFQQSCATALGLDATSMSILRPARQCSSRPGPAPPAGRARPPASSLSSFLPKLVLVQMLDTHE